MDTKISHATIIPLVGGSIIGASEALGSKPEYHLSYNAFAYNDSFIHKYWPEIPAYTIDSPDFNESKITQVDVVNSVCPCAGLSSLSMSSSSDSKVNDWMYESSEYVLKTVQPKVLWGENAPALATSKGRPVAERLAQIGRKYGYSYSMMKTDTFDHGIPQHRQRTFFFFWKSSTAPIIGYHVNKPPTLIEYLKQAPVDSKHNDEPLLSYKPSSTLEYKFLMEKNKYSSHEEMQKEIGYGPLLTYIIREIGIDEYRNWLVNKKQTKNIEKSISKIDYIKNKFSQDLGFMDSSPIAAYEYTNAIIARSTHRLMHPTEDRFYTIRELMHLMGLPHDFELHSTNNLNVICQNVSTVSARDMALEVKRFIEKDPEMVLAPANFVVQDNGSKQILEKRMIWDR